METVDIIYFLDVTSVAENTIYFAHSFEFQKWHYLEKEIQLTKYQS